MFTVFCLLVCVPLLLSPKAEAAPALQSARSLFESQAESGARWIPRRYLIRPHVMKQSVLSDEIARASCWVERWTQDTTIAIIGCPATQTDASWIGHLSTLPSVAWVDANYLIDLTNTPNDLSEQQWHLENKGQKIDSTFGTIGADISAVDAWAQTTGSQEIVVAIPDTGLNLEHTDLQLNLWSPSGEFCFNGIDDDGNGYVDDCYGWDFGNSDADVSPDTIEGGDCTTAHGTFIAGLIGADTNNDIGIAGLNWNIRLMPLKIAKDNDCSITAEGLLDSLIYAQNNGAHILNASFQFTEYIEAIDNAFKALSDNEILVTIPSGNHGKDIDLEPTYPVDFNHRATLIVGASNNQDLAASFSGFGPRVDLFAPGQRLRSTGDNNPNHYIWGSGTSYASPLVAATAALLLAEYPDLTTQQVRKAITLGVDPIEAFDCINETMCVGSGGRLNAANALVLADAFQTRGVPLLENVQFIDKVGDAIGDGDGQLERGEVAYISITTANRGSSPTDDFAVTVEITHPHTRMGRTDTRIPSIAIENTVTSEPVLSVSVSQECIENEWARITVHYLNENSGETWSDYQWFLLYCSIDDDEDGHLYPEDCNDLDPNIHPKMVESCNGFDDNCDGQIDGLGANGSVILFQDADGDGDGNPGISVAGCADTSGWSESNTDCDDSNPLTYLGADERCDTQDNDCDTHIDEEAIDRTTWYLDTDNDGLGNPLRTTLSCTQPPNHVANNDDCNEGPRRTCARPGGCSTAPVSPTQYGWISLLAFIGAFRLRMASRPKLFQV